MRFLQKAILQGFVHLKRARGYHKALALDEFRPEKVQKVLVVSSTAIGDALFATPGIRALRRLLPKVTLDFMVRDKVAPIFSNFPFVDNLVIYKGRYKNALELLSKIKRKHYDLCVVFHDSDPCPVEAAFAGGIPFIFRIGQKDEKTAHLLSTRIPYDNKKHAIDQRLEVLRRIFKVALDSPDDLRMELPVAKGDVQAFRSQYLSAFCNKEGQGERCKVIAFQFSASGSYKEWPQEYFIRLGRRLLKAEKTYNILLIGGPSDKKRAKCIKKAIVQGGMENRVLNMVGDIGLAKLPAALAATDLLVTNDTGPLHVAIAVGTRTVSLFVPTDVTSTGPIQDLHLHTAIVKPKPCTPCKGKYCKDADCMGLISVEEVFGCAVKALCSLES